MTNSPRDLVLWLLENNYSTEAFKLSIADHDDWEDYALQELQIMKRNNDNSLVDEFCVKLKDLGVNFDENRIKAKNVSNNDLQLDNSSPKIKTLNHNLESSDDSNVFNLVKKAITLRQEGDFQGSLDHLESISSSFSYNNLIDENKARALIKLKRFYEAYKIFQTLSSSEDDSYKERAAQIISDNLEKWIDVYKKNLMQFCDKNNWDVIELANIACDFIQFEKLIVKEAINMRRAKQAQLSLDLLLHSEEMGFDSPILLENQARALEALDQIDKAKYIWFNLSQIIGDHSSKKYGLTMISKYDLKFVEVFSESDLDLDASINHKSDVSAVSSDQPSDVSEEFIKDELKRSIVLRKSGDLEDSLNLLDTLIPHGIFIERIQDNRARVLVKMHNYADALLIWQSLLDSDNEKIKNDSQRLFDQYSVQWINRSYSQLKELCEKSEWQLNDALDSVSQFTEFLKFLSKESVEMRKAGNPNLSLDFILLAKKLGFKGDRLDDNHARALVALKRPIDAIDIWSTLAENSLNDKISKKALSMANKTEKSIIDKLVSKIDEITSSHQLDSINISLSDCKSFSQVEFRLLKSVVSMRNDSHDEAALEVIDSILATGLSRSDRLLDNRARILIRLNRHHDAIKIWESLLLSDDSDVQNKSKQFIQQSQAKLIKLLHNDLVSLCKEQGWAIQNINDDFTDNRSLSQLIVKEAIAIRKSGQADLSLKIIDMSINSGLDFPRLYDNQARALVNLKRIPEAVSIWRELVKNLDAKDNLRIEIIRKLDKYAVEADRIEIKEKCTELAQSKLFSEAKSLALNTMISHPDWEDSPSLLKDILKIESDHTHQGELSLLDQELQDDKLSLEAFELFINFAEEKLQST